MARGTKRHQGAVKRAPGLSAGAGSGRRRSTAEHFHAAGLQQGTHRGDWPPRTEAPRKQWRWLVQAPARFSGQQVPTHPGFLPPTGRTGCPVQCRGLAFASGCVCEPHSRPQARLQSPRGAGCRGAALW